MNRDIIITQLFQDDKFQVQYEWYGPFPQNPTPKHEILSNTSVVNACLECSISWIQATVGQTKDYKISICFFFAKQH
jgi:hypothetical protein